MADKKKATYIGTDDWSRVQIETEQGTRLCDTNCLDLEDLVEDPSLGAWHTYNDWQEPISQVGWEIGEIATGSTEEQHNL